MTPTCNFSHAQPSRHLDKEHPSFDYDSTDDPFIVVVNKKALHAHNHVVSRLSKYLFWCVLIELHTSHAQVQNTVYNSITLMR
jgi:hypothetical protein